MSQMIQQMPILIGQFLITDNRQEVYNLLSSNAPDLRFIDLEDIDQALPTNHPAVLGGNQILPPVDSLIAEQDGRADLYFDNYFRHMSQPEQEEYVAFLLCFLCNGGNIITYIPELNSTLGTMFRELMLRKYGIRIGLYPNEVTGYDYKYAPLWLWMMYGLVNFLDWKMFLKMYPYDAELQPYMIDKVMVEADPYGTTYEEKAQAIINYKNHIKENPKLIAPLFTTTG